MDCGTYKHFKGNSYYVFGIANTTNGEEFVLYKEDYGTHNFWIRPKQMFLESIKDKDSDTNIKRFKLYKEETPKDAIKKLSNILRNKNVLIKHTENGKNYYIAILEGHTNQIIISPIYDTSTYLTDSQLANRMGYFLYFLNGEKMIYKSPQSLFPEDKSLGVYAQDNEHNNKQDSKEIIKNQFNPCSIDLHISDEFFVPKFGVIDMANSMLYSIEAKKFWKKLNLRKINGEKGIALWPNQTVLTYTDEYISLPSDCAGKIEIKSTYARLSLSITASDFCNPGWVGHFPLTIKNNGKHIIILHEKEKMAQLLLVPTNAPIINDYSKSGVFMDDDGTPFKFWQSKTLKHIVSESENDSVLNLFNAVLSKISENSDDIENEKLRFQNTFLHYYQKKMRLNKYKSIKSKKAKAEKIWQAYKNKERTLKYLFSLPTKIFAFILSIGATLATSLINNNAFTNNTRIILSVVILIITIFLQLLYHIKTPKCFCTFEKIEFTDVYK